MTAHGRSDPGPADSPGYLVQAAAEVAELAGAVALRHFRGTLSVERKSDGTPVTAADREAEQAARAWIEERYSKDGIVGEEFGPTRAGAHRRWIIDPVDGTISFVRGVPLWGSLVAVAEGDRVLAGAACFPALGETVAAGRAQGCWWNGARCRVSEVADLARATVLTTDERFGDRPAQRAAWARLAARAGVSRSWGDCYGYLMVATGRAEVMADGILSPWDVAALSPIIEEAGGVFTDWSGRGGSLLGSAIATNRALAASVRALLGRGPAPVEEDS
jgi:histidinol phosphatase-like enzyme (inositol monophosphatase family)